LRSTTKNDSLQIELHHAMTKDKINEILVYFNKVKNANKEATKKEAFKDLLNRLYKNDAEILSVVDQITQGAEKAILNIPRKDKLHRGSADTLYNKIIIEFENSLKVSLNHAKEQLAGYLLGQFKSGHGYNYTLIVSDFINWKVVAPEVSQLDKLSELSEHDLKLDEIPSASITLNENNAEDFYYWIDRFLFKEEKQKATLKLIEDSFGYRSPVFIDSYLKMLKWFNEAKKFGEVQVSYEQWKKFLSVAYGSFNGSEENFLIHTYLSVFSKMLAYAVVSNDDYIDDKEMMAILDGTIFHKYNIRNFVDNDFFHWVKSELNFNNLKNTFRGIAQEISTFDFHNVDEDVLKGVYQELIDLDTRHALGEYYTPDWLCELVVAEFEFKSSHRILDPACGSGSFLRSAIHRLKKLNSDITVEELSSAVYGIDIHPLSVQIAKTTVLLALGQGVRNAKRPVHINVILANTLRAPEGINNLWGTDFRLDIDKEKYYLNTQILSDMELFDDAVDVCDDLAEQTLNKEKESLLALYNTLKRKNVKHGSISVEMQNSFYKIYEGLKLVKENGRDSIWKFIVQNSYKPYFLSKKFDYVIGNPPWFTYSDIRNEEYQDTLNKLATTLYVKPEKVANFPHLEIAAIFLSYCSSYFLKDDGKIAFVLPRSFFSADHHDNTRSGKAKGFKLSKAWDLEKVFPLFRVPSCVLFADKAAVLKKIPATGIEGKIYSGRLPAHNCNLKAAAPKLSAENVSWFYNKQGKSSAFSATKKKTQNKTNPYKKLFKQGATIVPRTFYFVELTHDAPIDWDDRIVHVKTADSVKTDAKSPWKELDISGSLESRFLYRTILSKGILPFALYQPELVALPVVVETEHNNKTIKLMSALELRREGYSEAAKWFQKVENFWDLFRTEKSKKMSCYDRINFQKGLSDQNLNAPYLVLYNASAKDANATIVKRESYDLEFIVESVCYVFYTDCLEEAYYLTSIFNSTVPNELMKDFQARGLFGARHVHKKILDIYYPKYDAANDTHQKLADQSKLAHGKANAYMAANTPTQQLSAIHLGRLRTSIKKHLAEELKEIDKLVKKIL
jgi:type I restriction-modification system DNA methylase subunit